MLAGGHVGQYFALFIVSPAKHSGTKRSLYLALSVWFSHFLGSGTELCVARDTLLLLC